MSKWTPGPRVADGHLIKSSLEGGLLALMSPRPFPEYGCFSRKQMDDNARLIAAAPEMAELIQKLLDRAGQIDQFTEQEARALLAKVNA